VLSALGINDTAVAVPPTPPTPPPPPPPTPSQSLMPSFAATAPTSAAPAPPARPRIVKPPAKNLAVTSANILDMFSVMYTVDGWGLHSFQFQLNLSSSVHRIHRITQLNS
jgi:hypothetical protein